MGWAIGATGHADFPWPFRGEPSSDLAERDGDPPGNLVGLMPSIEGAVFESLHGLQRGLRSCLAKPQEMGRG